MSTHPRDWPEHMQRALSKEDQLRYLGARLPAETDRVVGTAAVVRSSMAVQATTKPKLNRTETLYLNLLKVTRPDAVIHAQEIKFQIGEERCWYTPDFVVVGGPSIEVHEVKGARVWDDARVKFQAAKRMYPWIKWVWAQYNHGKWEINNG